MCNVASKSIIFAIGLMVLACGNSGSKDTTEAMELLEQANAAINDKDFSLATTLLDSIDHAYANLTDLRRKVLEVRPKLEEVMAISEMESTDSLIAQLQLRYDSIREGFDFVDNPELVEGYYVAKASNDPTFLDKTGIQSRVSKDGEFYMVSVVVGKLLNHDRISLTGQSGKSAESASIQYNDETNFHYGNSEMITFSHEQCDTIGKLAVEETSGKMTVKFLGSGGSYAMTLSAAQQQALRETYGFAQVIADIRKALLKKEYLDRRLQIARDQQAKNLPLSEVADTL